MSEPVTPTITEGEIAILRERHHIVTYSPFAPHYCFQCGDPWPCRTIRALDALAAARAECDRQVNSVVGAENWRDAAYADLEEARAVLRSLVTQHMGCPICSGLLLAEGVTHEVGCVLATALGPVTKPADNAPMLTWRPSLSWPCPKCRKKGGVSYYELPSSDHGDGSAKCAACGHEWGFDGPDA